MMMNKHKSLFFDIYYQGLNVNRLKLYDHAKGILNNFINDCD